jgi:hypothetical protein
VDFHTIIGQNGSPRERHAWTSSRSWVHARQGVQRSIKDANDKVA